MTTLRQCRQAPAKVERLRAVALRTFVRYVVPMDLLGAPLQLDLCRWYRWANRLGCQCVVPSGVKQFCSRKLRLKHVHLTDLCGELIQQLRLLQADISKCAHGQRVGWSRNAWWLWERTTSYDRVVMEATGWHQGENDRLRGSGLRVGVGRSGSCKVCLIVAMHT